MNGIDLLNSACQLMIAIAVGMNARHSILLRVYALLCLASSGFGLFLSTSNETIIVLATISAVKAMLLLLVSYQLTGRKVVMPIALVFIISIFAAPFSSGGFARISIVISLLLNSVSFVLIALKRELKIAGSLGLVSCLTGLMIIAASRAGLGAIPWFWQDILLLPALWILSCQPIAEPQAQGKAMITALGIARFLAFVAVALPFLLLSTSAIHELGHALVGIASNCNIAQAGLYDYSHYPPILVECSEQASERLTLAGGFVVTLLISLLLALTGIRMLRSFSLIIFAFNILLSYNDFQRISSTAVFWLLFFSMLALIIIGVRSLAAAFIDEDSAFFGREQ